MKKRITALLLTLALCAGLTVPTLAADYFWDVSEDAQTEAQSFIPNSDWKTRVQVDGMFATGYVKYSDYQDYATVCYCTAPARVTVLEYVIDYGGQIEPVVVSSADVMDLGGSMVRYTLAADGTLVEAGVVEPTYLIPVDVGEEWTANGAGTYWELEDGLYFMFSVEASKTLFLVVGDLVENTDNVETVPEFTDVTGADWFYDAVNWAVAANITKGTGDNAFSPARTCTQGEILTFLWRAAGEPEAAIDNPYGDSVEVGAYYYDALLWAWDAELIDDAAMDPNAACQRSAVVTYLWKLAERPACDGSVFTDVPADADYADAVAWAVEAGITTGSSTTTFSPAMTCDRGQIVTFLHRFFVGE